jgi:triacylglycerol lipase
VSPTYNQQQTTFFLSMLSNLAGGMKGTVDQIEQSLAGKIDAHLQASTSDIGPWTRVWGPAVFQAPLSSVADNVMYVARGGATPPQLVVAIAGTNYASVFDVLIEDFFVGKEVSWQTGNPPAGAKPQISAGTFTGLTVLQVLTPGPGYPGANQQLAAFLASAVDQPMNVTITGHSLGGALSSALALWLSDTQAAWDPSARATIYCEPSAGPTAGNGDFAGYYDQALGSRTSRIHNSLDIAPDAWNDADLSRIATLYQPDITPDIVVYALAATARAAAAGGDYTQISQATPPLTGTINTTIINPGSYAFENFMSQAIYQHIEEYITLMGVSFGAEDLAAIRAAMAPPVATLSAALRAQLQRRRAIPAGAR